METKGEGEEGGGGEKGEEGEERQGEEEGEEEDRIEVFLKINFQNQHWSQMLGCDAGFNRQRAERGHDEHTDVHVFSLTAVSF